MANHQDHSDDPERGSLLQERIQTGVLADIFQGIAEEMAIRLRGSAYTTFVRETNDFAIGLATPEGDLFAYPLQTGVVTFVGLPLNAVAKSPEIIWNPKDTVITNDPFSSAGMATHLTDMHFMRPVFYDNELVCFVWAFAHFTDIGGVVPGSIQMTNTEIQQEGLRLRPIKLCEGGIKQSSVENVILDNSRIPDLCRGDIDAALSALALGETRVTRVFDRYGKAAVRRAMYGVLDEAETVAKDALARIPNGSYDFTELFEDNYVSDIPIRLDIRVISDGGRIDIDLTGCDPEVDCALNLPAGDQAHHPFLARAILGYVMTVAPEIRFNAGIMRNVYLKHRKYSILNCSAPAPVGMRSVTAMRLHDAVLGALLQASGSPECLPVGGAGHVVITYIYSSSGVEGQSGTVVVANPVQGGSGGSSAHDGLSGSDRPTAHLRSVPAEVLESLVPVIVRKFALVPDSEGAGRRRGGFGVEFELEMLEPGCSVVMRGKDRHQFAAWGAYGGEAGNVGACSLIRADGSVVDLGKATVYEPGTGERVVLRGPGGGGYGNPLEREPDRVARDVRDGLISIERARERYQVVLTSSGDVDELGTKDLRGESESPGKNTGPSFDYGPGRTAWSERFGGPTKIIQEWLWSLPRGTRNKAKTAAYRHLQATPERIPVADLEELLDRLSIEMKGGVIAD